MSFLYCKSTATLLPTRYVLAINETFQMNYCTKFYLNGIRITTCQSQKLKKAFFNLDSQKFDYLFFWCDKMSYSTLFERFHQL